MSRTLTAVLGLVALLGAATAYAGPAGPAPGQWSRETRQIGTKGTVDLYHRTPYALTGTAAPARKAGSTSRAWTHEARQAGNKVTFEAFNR